MCQDILKWYASIYVSTYLGFYHLVITCKKWRSLFQVTIKWPIDHNLWTHYVSELLFTLQLFSSSVQLFNSIVQFNQVIVVEWFSADIKKVAIWNLHVNELSIFKMATTFEIHHSSTLPRQTEVSFKSGWNCQNFCFIFVCVLI